MLNEVKNAKSTDIDGLWCGTRLEEAESTDID